MSVLNRKLRKLFKDPKLFFKDSRFHRFFFRNKELMDAPASVVEAKKVVPSKSPSKKCKYTYDNLNLNTIKKLLSEGKSNEVREQITILWANYAWFTKLVKAYVFYYESKGCYFQAVELLGRCVKHHNNSKELRFLYLQYLKKSGCYDSNIIDPYANKLLYDYPTDKHIRYFWCQHLWETEGVTGNLINHLNVLQKNGGLTPNQLQFIAQCLCDSGKYLNAINIYGDCRDQVTKKSYVLEQIYQMKNVPDKESASKIEKLDFRELSKFSKNFESMIKESKTLAIVGNGPTEIGKGSGKRIDNADLVIRFNNYSTGAEFAVDYGTKTNIWVRGGYYIDIQRKETNELLGVIVSGNNVLFRSLSVEEFLLDAYMYEREMAFIPPYIYYELIHILKAPPSSGIAILYWVYKIKGYINKEWVYGFSFGQQKENQAEHYFNNSSYIKTGFFQHDWDAEGELIRSFLKENI